LTRYLGFEPNQVEATGKYFDLMNGVFRNEKPLHIHFLQPEITTAFSQALQADFTSMHKLIYTRENRVLLLKGIIDYYRLHIPVFQKLHSLDVLQSLFD